MKIFKLAFMMACVMFQLSKANGCELEIRFYVFHNLLQIGDSIKTVDYNIILKREDLQGGNSFRKGIPTGYIEGEIIDCMGRLNFTITDTINCITIKGQFLSCPDTLKNLLYIEVPGMFDGEIIVQKYVTPIKDGKWIFIDDKRGITETKTYKRGFYQPTE